MNIEQKLNEYKENIETLAEIDSLEVYQWLMSLGEKLANDPLSKERHLQGNKVTKCQYDMYVDIEEGRFKAWSMAMIAGMFPMALGLGEGGEQTAPLGRAVIGGLIGATLATLTVLPCVFTMIQARTGRRSPSLVPGENEANLATVGGFH